MATRQALQVGIVIGATNNATPVIQNMVNQANSSMRGLVGGLANLGLGAMAKKAYTEINQAYSGQEYSLASLRIAEMDRLGAVNERVYGKEEEFVRSLSNKYAKSVEEYAGMATVLRQNRISAEDLLGGVGETTAKLGKLFDNMEARPAALFFARLKNDLRVPASEMERLANMAFKLKQIGVGGGDANKTIDELTEAYSKAGLGAVNLGMKGAEDAEQLGVLMGTFIAKGITGQTTGNNFRRIFDGMRDPERVGKVMRKGAEYGVQLSFYDGNGKFKGIKNFEEQLAKIGKLNIQQRAEVLKPFSGKQGLSTDFLEYLAKYSEDVAEIRNQYENITDMESALHELMKTQTIQNAQLESSKENLKAAFGESISKDVKRLNSFMRDINISLTDFVRKHPDVTKIGIEFGLVGAAVASLYGGLVLVGNYIPVVAGLASGLAGSVAGIVGAVGSLMIYKEFLDSNQAKEKQLALNPNTQKSRLIQGYDKIIADPNTGMIKRFLAKSVQAGIIRNTQLFGDHSPDQTNRESWGQGFINFGTWDKGPKIPNPNYKPKDYNLGNGWKALNLTWQQFMDKQFPNRPTGPGTTAKTPVAPQSNVTLQYSPNIVLPAGGGGGLTADDVNKLLKQNTDVLLQTMERAQMRNRNMTYGNTK